jgi:hypothetical protein
LTFVVLIAFGVGAFFGLPFAKLPSAKLTEEGVERTCREQPEQCRVVAREFGNQLLDDVDIENGMRWHQRAAEQGDVVAMFHLGWLHEVKASEAIQKEFLNLIKRSQSGDLGAYSEPAAATQHFRTSETWYRKAADEGFAPAMNNLAQVYTRQKGRNDPNGAMQWFLAAARAGNPIAHFNLALMYNNGAGVRADQSESERWSAWKPTKFSNVDLSEPVLQRTMMFGTPPSESLRIRLRRAAFWGFPSVTLELKRFPAESKVAPPGGVPAQGSRKAN